MCSRWAWPGWATWDWSRCLDLRPGTREFYRLRLYCLVSDGAKQSSWIFFWHRYNKAAIITRCNPLPRRENSCVNEPRCCYGYQLNERRLLFACFFKRISKFGHARVLECTLRAVIFHWLTKTSAETDRFGNCHLLSLSGWMTLRSVCSGDFSVFRVLKTVLVSFC